MTASQKSAKLARAKAAASRCREIDVAYPEWVRFQLHGSKRKAK